MPPVSTAKSKKDSISVVGEASRVPQQGRSRASYERMLAAAEKLMVKNGNDDFTLTEVAKVGKVSIGSIYLRFNSKDDMIHAVHARVLARIEEDQDAMMAKIVGKAATLDDFSALFVDAYAELLKSYAPVLRPIMFRAIYDQNISQLGRQSAERLSNEAERQLLRFSAEFGRPDHQRLVGNAFKMIYNTLARLLGLGSSLEAAHQGDWDELKEDLSIMCAAFLRAPAR